MTGPGEPRRAHPSFSRGAPPLEAILEVDESMLVRRDGSPQPEPTPAVARAVAGRLWGPDSSRLALLHGALPVLRKGLGCSFEEAVVAVRRFRRALCEAVFEHLLERYPEVFNPLGVDYFINEFDIDGYDVNHDFLGTGIDFMSTKQAHFDIVEPLGSNLYGPNRNVEGGYPTFSDARAYCQDNGLKILEILDKVPGSRNLTVAPEHYRRLIEDYTIVLKVDTSRDTPFTIFVNRIEEAGLLHGATTATAIDPDAAVHRPLRHLALDSESLEAAEDWYRALGQSPDRVAGDSSAPKPLVPQGLQLRKRALVIEVS